MVLFATFFATRYHVGKESWSDDMLSFSNKSISSEEEVYTDFPSRAFDFAFGTLDQDPLSFAAYEDKAILIVNTALDCCLSYQYHELQALYKQYNDKGLQIVAVNTLDFSTDMAEKKSEEHLRELKERYGICFPVTIATQITGDRLHPFYRWLKTQLKQGRAQPRWHFYKYLIGRDGEVFDWFSPLTSPMSQKVQRSVEKVLEETKYVNRSALLVRKYREKCRTMQHGFI
jgi:glutathione peroxidase